MADIHILRKVFIKGTNKGEFKKYIKSQFDIKNIDIFKAAVSQGYDDAKRTFTKISTFWASHEKDDFFTFTAEKIQGLCKHLPSETWHDDICRQVCDWFRERAHTIQYGQAQKIINMAFKYLYCLDGAEKYTIFKQCHMPLDSFTLEWYKRFVYKKDSDTPKIASTDTWSNLKRETYCKIAVSIAEHLKKQVQFCYKNHKITLPVLPLDAEFYIWPEMQMHLSAESFFFSFNTMSQQEKNAWKEKGVFEKMDAIKNHIDTYIKR